jgi:hypothetical protein
MNYIPWIVFLVSLEFGLAWFYLRCVLPRRDYDEEEARVQALGAKVHLTYLQNELDRRHTIVKEEEARQSAILARDRRMLSYEEQYATGSAAVKVDSEYHWALKNAQLAYNKQVASLIQANYELTHRARTGIARNEHGEAHSIEGHVPLIQPEPIKHDRISE